MNKFVIFALALAGISLAFLIFLRYKPVRIPDLSGDIGSKAANAEFFKIGETAFSVEIADTSESRANGLSGRENLGADSGMLFVFDAPASYGFWMKGMKFPLDMVWISGDSVVGFSENLPPASGLIPKIYFPPEPVDKALELNAGSVKMRGLKVGDKVQLGLNGK